VNTSVTSIAAKTYVNSGKQSITVLL